LSDSEQEKISPKRSVGISGGILYGIGCGIGGSIFTLLGRAIGNAGPGVLISFILGGVLIFFTALNFSELATSLPISGGGYSFSKEAMGGFLAFLIGFFLWIANIALCSFSAQVFTFTLYVFFPILEDYIIFIEIVSILFIGIIIFRTTRRATKILISLTIILILFLVIFIIAGIVIAPITNASDFNFNYFFSPTNFFGVILMFPVLFVGFTSITSNLAYLSSDLKNPSKNIPKVFIIAITMTLFLYLLITFVVLINIGDDVENIIKKPVLLAEILLKILGPFGFILMGSAAIISTLISMNAAIGSAVSILFALARDNYVHKSLKKVSKRTGMPIYSLIITLAVAILFTIFTTLFGFAAEITSLIYLFGLAFINFGAVLLRNKRKELSRPFKVPFFPYLPIIVGSMCLIFAFILSPIAILLGIIILSAGISYYVLKIADRNSIVLTVSGFKFLSTCLLGVFIWITANFTDISSAINGFNDIFLEIILRILIYIGIFTFGTVALDVIPLREMVYFFIKKVDREMIAIGDGQIIELGEKRLKVIHIVNLILGILQITFAVFIFFVVYFVGSDIINLEQVLLGGTIIYQDAAEYFSLTILILFGLSISISGVIQLYSSRELKRLRI